MKDTKKLQIGFAICDPGLSFGAVVGLGAKERAAELGVNLSVKSVSTPADQVKLIDRFIHQRVDALIIEAVESHLVVPAIEKANAINIPVIIVDMGVQGGQIACTVRADNVKGGELAAEYLVEQLGGQGKIAHLQGLFTAQNGIDRSQGFHNVLDRYPEIQIVFEKNGEWTREAGARLMHEALAQHPDIQAVFAANDPMALGAATAIEEAGRTGEIIVAGFDALPDALLAIKDGHMDATVRQAPRRLGRLAVEIALSILRGERVPPRVLTEVTLVTADSVVDASLYTLRLFSGILRDLMDSSAALAEERTLLRTLIDNLPDFIYVKDIASRFALTNSALLRFLGAATQDEVIGKTDFDFLPHEMAAQFYADEQEIFQSGEPLINHEESVVDSAGNRRWLLTTKAPLRDSYGEIVGLVGMNRDITERKQLEAQLLQSQKMESIGQLAGGIAHDFNNLLTAILGHVSFILTDLDPASSLYQELLTIQEAGERAEALTYQLLAFSRRQILQPELLNVNTIVSGMSQILQRLIGEDIELITRLGSDPGLVKADPNQLEQVIINLAINARDAMPHGGKLIMETANVELDAKYASQLVEVKPGPYVMLAISDTGQGIDPEIKEHIFEPFFTTKPSGKGTGLGLAMVHGIVHQSGGHIWLSSEPDQGTTFKIYLPRVVEHESTARPQPTSTGTPYGTESILLVEDEEMVRQLANRALRKYGYTVLEAADGAEALQVAQTHAGPIDLVITDVIMPGGLSGPQLVQELHSLYPTLKVLYMSGYTDNAIGHHGVLDSNLAFLPKPFTPEVLAQKVRDVLDEPGQ